MHLIAGYCIGIFDAGLVLLSFFSAGLRNVYVREELNIRICMYYIKQHVLETCRKKLNRMSPAPKVLEYYQRSHSARHFSRKTRRNDIHYTRPA